MAARQNRIAFDNFEADLATGELFHNGTKIPIQQKPFQILALLLQNAGELVTRDELSTQLWPDTYVQKDLSLNTAVRKLRIALGESGRNTTFIETVGSRGYRFVAPVQFPPDFRRANLAAPVPVRVRVAVLPFENVGPEDTVYFSDGITEQLIARLGRVHRHISVVAPVSSMQYRRTQKTAAQITMELRADYVLTGSVALSGDRVRVTAKLIRSSDQSCVWTETYSRMQQEVFAIQDEITDQIARSLVRVLPDKTGNIPATHATAPEIYRKFLKANYLANRWQEGTFQRAIELFGEVMREDPKYAPAYSACALALCVLSQYGVLHPQVLQHRVGALCEQALALDANDETAWLARAWTEFYYHGDIQSARESCCRALAINPNVTFGYIVSSHIAFTAGQRAEAFEAMRKALDIDPLSVPVVVFMGTLYFHARSYDDAEAWFREALEMDSTVPTAMATLGWALEAKQDFTGAAQLYAAAASRAGHHGFFEAHRARGLALTGHRREAEAVLAKLIRERNDPYLPSYWIALVYLSLEEKEKALDWIELGIRDHCGWRMVMGVDPRLDALRSHPRFRAAVDALGLRLTE